MLSDFSSHDFILITIVDLPTNRPNRPNNRLIPRPTIRH